jgi:hypothetical protein
MQKFLLEMAQADDRVTRVAGAPPRAPATAMAGTR